MSEEALKRFLEEQVYISGNIQNQLKATDSFDDFVDLMVRLGQEHTYSFSEEEVKALVQSEINKQKERMDDESNEQLDQEMTTHWKEGKFVETGIQNLRGDGILPLYP